LILTTDRRIGSKHVTVFTQPLAGANPEPHVRSIENARGLSRDRFGAAQLWSLGRFERMASKSAAFNDWWSGYELAGSITPVQLGMTRDDLRALFGEPDDTARGWRRRPLMGIWKFGVIEFHFDTDGRLYLIYTEDEDCNPRVIAKDPAA